MGSRYAEIFIENIWEIREYVSTICRACFAYDSYEWGPARDGTAPHHGTLTLLLQS